MLLCASFLALYFELVVIRYLSSEIRLFAYLKNLPLIASFFGIGLGMILGKPPKMLKKLFPFIMFILFFIIVKASDLGLTHVPLPTNDYLFMGTFDYSLSAPYTLIKFFIIVFGILALIIAFFTVLGGFIGAYLEFHKPLYGYSINLLGSVAGVVAFIILSFASTPPLVWIVVGIIAILPFYNKNIISVAMLILLLFLIGVPNNNIIWSPYYRISLNAPSKFAHVPPSSLYLISVNHDYHQKIMNLSREFMSQNNNLEPFASAYKTYELPYLFKKQPQEVLIVGAGSGNDVAAALRNNATHIDAVEIDPVIIKLGRLYHPEKPYDSPRVTIYNNDARAFFHTTKKKYDLIIFGYLDAHTLLSSFSSIRLDDYIYTTESFKEAKTLLAKDGVLVAAFASQKSFISDRLFLNLTRAFGKPPSAYFTQYDGSGVVFVEDSKDATLPNISYPDISAELKKNSQNISVSTDRWPFLYLKKRGIPPVIFFVFSFFILISYFIINRLHPLKIVSRQNACMLFLGAGFLLLETKSITEISLLFGSTWVVNSIVIASFLVMAFGANAISMKKTISPYGIFCMLIAVLVINIFIPISLFASLSGAIKIIVSFFFVGLPVFFSGFIFSQIFRNSKNPSQSLGLNLFGAMLGGAFENTVMLGGTSILGLLAIIIYVVSFIVWRAKSPYLS